MKHASFQTTGRKKNKFFPHIIFSTDEGRKALFEVVARLSSLVPVIDASPLSYNYHRKPIYSLENCLFVVLDSE